MDDYISREAALRKCRDADDYNRIRKIPAANVRPVVRGKWIPSINQDLPGYLMCSACKEAFFNPSAQPHKIGFNYCFNCGADMRGETNGNWRK